MSFGALLKLVLWLIAIHSTCYGIALILFSPHYFALFGFDLPQTFFADQGGIFHILISTVYIFAALDLKSASRLIFITCLVKFSAFVFLTAWYLFGLSSWIILVSGILDLLIGVTVWLLYLGYRRSIICEDL